jgi:hypothetical protein
MPSWPRAKDSSVTAGTSSASASASPAWAPETPEPEKKTFGQLKSSINMGSIGKKVGKAITLPGLKLGTLTKESSAALGMFCFLILSLFSVVINVIIEFLFHFCV